MTNAMKPFGSSDEQPSPSAQPIAIVGMACRFPGASNISAFWRLLAAGQNAVSEGVPGSGVGRWGQLFPDDTVQNESCRYGAFRRRHRPVRRHLLPNFAGGSGTAGSAAAHDAGDELGGSRRRGNRSGGIEGEPHRRVHRDQQRRIPNAGRGLEQARRGCRVPLRAQRHQPERGQRTGFLCAGSQGAGEGSGRCVRVIYGIGPWTRWQTCSRARRIWPSPEVCRRS